MPNDKRDDIPSEFSVWAKKAARIVLESKGFDLTQPSTILSRQDEIYADPKLLVAARILGIFPLPAGDAANLISEADQDPLLWHIPSSDRLAVCRSRGRLGVWCLMGNGPLLSHEESLTLHRLNAAEDPFGALQKVLITPLEEDLGALPSARAEEFERKWIRESVTLYTLIADSEFDETEASVAEFFGDSLPLTTLRLFAWEEQKARQEQGFGSEGEARERKLN